jgi:hypothetical protein
MSGDKGLYAGLEDLNLFPFREPYQFGKEKSQEISEKMIGRSIATPHDAGILVQAVMNSKHGDHVEIGTFYGHSAILIACAKKEFGMHGKIYCVDPWNYRPEAMKDWGTKSMATDKVVMENASKFGVEDLIITIPKVSYPWPLELDNKTFATGYIDGDHWNGMPKRDWETLKERVTYSIIFDDYCWGKTEVIGAVIEAMSNPLWIPVQISGLTVVLRKRH